MLFGRFSIGRPSRPVSVLWLVSPAIAAIMASAVFWPAPSHAVVPRVQAWHHLRCGPAWYL